MNLAFTTILIFIIIAPGFLSRIAYNSSNLSVRDPNKNIVNELTWSIIPSLTIHIIAVFLVEFFTDYYIDFRQLGNLILGVKSNNIVEKNFIQLREFLYPIFYYNLAVFTASFFVGYLFQKIVRYFKWDRTIRYFRFSNKWHYIFTGECLDFPDVPDKYEEITDKIINVLCKVNDQTILYSGEHFNYYINSKGDLDAIHLKYPIRRHFKDDKIEEKDYYKIESRYLVIPNSDIININFRYLNTQEITLEELTEEERNSLIDFKDLSQKEIGDIEKHL